MKGGDGRGWGCGVVVVVCVCGDGRGGVCGVVLEPRGSLDSRGRLQPPNPFKNPFWLVWTPRSETL